MHTAQKQLNPFAHERGVFRAFFRVFLSDLALQICIHFHSIFKTNHSHKITHERAVFAPFLLLPSLLLNPRFSPTYFLRRVVTSYVLTHFFSEKDELALLAGQAPIKNRHYIATKYLHLS